MQSVTVLVRMTGLLLFSPTTPQGGGPTNIILPTTFPLPPHVAQLGYRKRTGDGCAYWQDDICYVDVRGWSLEIGTPGNASPAPQVRGNASRAQTVHRPVPARNVGHNPILNVRARFKLYEGQQDSTCDLGRFTLRNEIDVPLTNVVYWRFSYPSRTLVIYGARLNSGLGNPPRSEFLRVAANSSNVIELFIRHVPRSEQAHTTEADRIRRARHPGRGPHSKQMDPGDSATHFSAYYRLLDPPGRSGPLPVFVGRTSHPPYCVWARGRGNRLLEVIANAGTMSCMVAAGDPP
jgi:hypothetical protein